MTSVRLTAHFGLQWWGEDVVDDYWTMLHLKFMYSTALYFTVLRFRPQGGRAPSRVMDGAALEVHGRYSRLVQCLQRSVLGRGRVRAVARTSCE